MVKRKIIWSARAKKDLIEILEFYYQRNGTKTYSRKLNTRIHRSISLLASYAEIGIQTDVANIRNLIEGDLGIFYEIRPKTIEIITIWDHRQHPDTLEV